MGWFDKIADTFNGNAKPSEGALRRLVGRTKTRAGRFEYMELLTKHPDCINATDKNHKSALYHAAADNDTEVMAQLIKRGINPYFYHDAIYAAAHGAHQGALDLLISAGGVVGDDHIEVTGNMAIYYDEDLSRGGDPVVYYQALDMLKAAYKAQEEKRAADEEMKKQLGPLVLTDNISVRKPLKLRRSYVTSAI